MSTIYSGHYLPRSPRGRAVRPDGYDAGNFVRTLEKRQGLQTGCPEEIAFEAGWITEDALREQAQRFSKNSYGRYLLGLLAPR